MLKYNNVCAAVPSSPLLPVSSNEIILVCKTLNSSSSIGALKLGTKQTPNTLCRARRRVRDGDDGDEEYGHNAEIAMLELYSQSARAEALLVRAMVDEKEAEVLIFKGFSSCLSYETSPDLSKSVLPARAVITCIDRIKGPFDPSNIEYLEKGLTWDIFKCRFLSSAQLDRIEN